METIMNTKDYHKLVSDKLKIKRSKIIQKNILIQHFKSYGTTLLSKIIANFCGSNTVGLKSMVVLACCMLVLLDCLFSHCSTTIWREYHVDTKLYK